MALIYEHWRPDTNECFYVGASRKVEDVRAAKFSRDNDDYTKIVTELSEKGETPFYKIIWDGLEDDCVGTYEKIRIAYQKALLGKKLTNKAKGGDGFNINWDNEMREKASVRQKVISSNPKRRQQHSAAMTAFFSIEENRKKQSEILTAFFDSEEGKRFLEKNRIKSSDGLKNFSKTEEGQESYRDRGIKFSELVNSTEFKIKNDGMYIKTSNSLKEYAQTEEGKKDYEVRGNKIGSSLTSYFESQNGRLQAMLHSWWMSNIRNRDYWGA